MGQNTGETWETGELAGMINKSIILLTTLYCLEDFCTHRGGEGAGLCGECVREGGRSQH